ncbi:MAG: hypothetical protein QM647_15985 [Asticcacaulis sp.]|uniref:hypothetical protein n=1 Tax=Asticcacaulis sp. TaxID=1872648 RepID=UPI0039E5D5A9
MLDTTHPGTYSVYWNLPPLRKPSYINALTISLGLFAATLTGAGVAVASQFSHLPSPEDIAVIPPGAEGMNIYPVTETADVWLAPHSEAAN